MEMNLSQISSPLIVTFLCRLDLISYGTEVSGFGFS